MTALSDNMKIDASLDVVRGYLPRPIGEWRPPGHRHHRDGNGGCPNDSEPHQNIAVRDPRLMANDAMVRGENDPRQLELEADDLLARPRLN